MGRFPTCSSPVRHVNSPKRATFDLHALGTPPALILSQDQTLHQIVRLALLPYSPSKGLSVQRFQSQGSRHCHSVLLLRAGSPALAFRTASPSSAAATRHSSQVLHTQPLLRLRCYHLVDVLLSANSGQKEPLHPLKRAAANKTTLLWSHSMDRLGRSTKRHPPVPVLCFTHSTCWLRANREG